MMVKAAPPNVPLKYIFCNVKGAKELQKKIVSSQKSSKKMGCVNLLGKSHINQQFEKFIILLQLVDLELVF